MSLGDRDHNILEGIFWCRGRDTLSIHYIIKKRAMVCRVVGGAGAVDGQAQRLEDKILADVFGLKSGVTT